MLPTSKNIYHPFRDSLLGFFENENIASGNGTGFALEDISLYYQPVPDPRIATLFSFIWLALFFVGEYLYIKVLIMIRKEKGILEKISTLFVTAIMILTPVVMILTITTNFVHPLNELLGQWFCTTARFIIYFLTNVVLCHSFVVAVTRYCFIVHTSKVESYGKEKVQKLCLCLGIIVPLCITLWKITDGAELDSLSFINKCNGKHHESFLIETSTLNVFKKSFCGLGSYDERNAYSRLTAILKQLFCLASSALIMLMGSNITEGIIYYRLFSYMNRYAFLFYAIC